MINNTGEYYVELDAESNLFCVFHTDKGNGKAYASFSTVAEAKNWISALK